MNRMSHLIRELNAAKSLDMTDLSNRVYVAFLVKEARKVALRSMGATVIVRR